MDQDVGGRHCRSRAKETRASSPTERATKRDRSRTTRPPLSPRIDEFARQLQQHESAGSTSTRKSTSRGTTSQQPVRPAVSTAETVQPSTSAQPMKRRHSSSVSATRGKSPVFKASNVIKRTCNVCGEVMYARNWIRHLERCHKNAAGAARTRATSGDRLEQVAQVERSSRRRAAVDAVHKKHHLRRCISLVYPYACLDLPTAVQMSYVKHVIPGMSRYDRSICVTTINLLMAKFRNEMRFARTTMETRHFCKLRQRSVQSHPEIGSAVGAHTQLVEAEDHRDPIAPDDTSIIADSASLFSATENVELLESINAAVELPQLTGDDLERNIPRAEQGDVIQPTEPSSYAKQSCTTKQLLQPSTTSTAGQLVTAYRGAPTEKRTAAEAVVTSSLLAVETNQQRRPAQARPPVTHRVTNQRATSPAARIKSWQDDAEKRGSSRPRDTRRSTKSRSPAREAHGYQRRDPRRDRSSRSPRRVERRVTPRSSPPRHLQHERGRDDARRDDRPREREPPDTNEQLFSEFLTFVKRRRE